MIPQKKVEFGNLTTKDKVVEFQKMCAELPQLEMEEHTTHTFGGGMYARQLFRPKGTLIIGKVHKKEHLYLIMNGSVLVTTDGEPKQYDGPCIVVSKPGTKRAVLALTDATCVMIVRTDKMQVDEELEKELVEEDPYSRFDIHNRIIDKQIEFKEKSVCL